MLNLQAWVLLLVLIATPLWPLSVQAASICARIQTVTEHSPQHEAGRPKVEIRADDISFPAHKLVHLRGYAQLIHGGYRVSADELIYHKGQESAEARGVVKFTTPLGDLISTPVLHYDIAHNQATSGPAEFILASREVELLGSGRRSVNAYGTAERIFFDGDGTVRLQGADVATCLEGKEDLTFLARGLRMDLEGNIHASGRQAKLRVLAPSHYPQLKELIN